MSTTSHEQTDELARDMSDAIHMLAYLAREIRDRWSVMSSVDSLNYRMELAGIIRVCEGYRALVNELLTEANEQAEELQAKDALIDDLLEQINLKVQAEGDTTTVDESVQIMARMKSPKDYPPLKHH